MIFDLVVDLILLAILSLVTYSGYNKGFFLIFIGPWKNLICIYLAYLLSDDISSTDSIKSRIISFILLFILFRFVFKTAIYLLNMILDKGILRVLNKILGLVLAGILAFALSWLFCIALDVILEIDLLKQYVDIYDFNGGPIYSYFRGISPLEILSSLYNIL